MAGRLWRNSAGLILACSRNCRYGIISETCKTLDKSAVVTVSPLIFQTMPHRSEDFEILFVKRSVEAKFMGDSHVFPGGVLDEADYSPQWFDLFSTPSGYSVNSLVQWFPKTKRLPIYDTFPVNGIPGEVAMRICAIRETFEESGVLLARNMVDVEKFPKAGGRTGTVRPCVKCMSDKELSHWRDSVHENTENFLKLCRELCVLPDVWSLIEWSNWLTPENLHRRYDTVFYMCGLDQQSEVSPELKEIAVAEWLSPKEALTKFADGSVILPPPQYSEVSLFNMFPSLPCLHSYALHKSIFGSPSRGLPVRVKAKDKILSLLPGDDLYPDEYDDQVDHPMDSVLQCRGKETRGRVSLTRSDHQFYEYTIKDDVPFSEIEAVSQQLSRMVFHRRNDFELINNMEVSNIQSFITDYQLLVNNLRSNL